MSKQTDIPTLITKVREILPTAQFEYDNYGQLIIYTDVFDSDRGEED
jgi:hypothetical protein